MNSTPSVADIGPTCMNVPKWGVLTAVGADAPAFLHKFCTNDVASLQPGQGCEAFFTDVKGKVLAHGIVLRDAEACHLLLPAANTADLQAHLERYVIREDVAFCDQSDDCTICLLSSDRACDALQIGDVARAVPTATWSHVALETNPCETEARLVRAHALGASAWLLIISQNALPAWRRVIETSQLNQPGDDEFEQARIAAGWPLWGVDFGPENLPQEVDRDVECISFRKGCYLGQETVARLDAMGHVNRQLRLIEFASPATSEGMPKRGELLSVAGAEAGVLTSVAPRPVEGRWRALAMLKKNALAPGMAMQGPAGSAQVVDRPRTP
ncbi:MAG: hypothetical protein KDA61_13960 [Planctomycetales bacterium]|nr:hypothetical protein [Planctomycetales bacterium]